MTALFMQMTVENSIGEHSQICLLHTTTRFNEVKIYMHTLLWIMIMMIMMIIYLISLIFYK